MEYAVADDRAKFVDPWPKAVLALKAGFTEQIFLRI
jgi:hypothetical protein